MAHCCVAGNGAFFNTAGVYAVFFKEQIRLILNLFPDKGGKLLPFFTAGCGNAGGNIGAVAPLWVVENRRAGQAAVRVHGS